MRAADYFDEIVSSFRKQRLRTLLTATGIGIGAFAIALMVGLGQGLQSYIEAQIRAFGNPRIVMVMPDTTARATAKIGDLLAQFGKPATKIDKEEEEDRRTMRGGLTITPEQAQKVREIPGVKSLAPFTMLELDGVALLDEDGKTQSDFYKVDFATLVTNQILGTPVVGAIPSATADAEVVLAPQYAESFHVARAAMVGREVVLHVPNVSTIQRSFQFRDPTKYKDEHEDLRARVVGLSEESPMSRVVYCSLPLGREMARYESQNRDLLSDEKIGVQATVRIADDADPATVKEEIRKLGLTARSTEEQLQAVSKTFLVVDSFLALFGMIALLVATFGIANTLLMAITERTREIGVMKALGASEGTIRLMFALEASAIGLVGGTGGTLFAALIGAAGNAVAHRTALGESLQGYSVFLLPWWLGLGAVAFATLIGALAGLYPANRAARLDPIEALRFE